MNEKVNYRTYICNRLNVDHAAKNEWTLFSDLHNLILDHDIHLLYILFLLFKLMVAARELCMKPYGPYKDEVVLNTAFPATRGRTLPRLTSVHILKDGKETGFVRSPLFFFHAQVHVYSIRLDATEFLEPRPVIDSNSEILFIGNLLVDNLAWLSPQGLEYLEIDLRARAPANDQGWTLPKIYKMNKKITVQICCTKNLPASYMLSE